MDNLIEIQDLCVATDGLEILKGLSINVRPGEVHAIMGPNGAGKSTLAKVLAGHPFYEVTSGQILFQGKDLLSMEVEERAHAGLFMSFQYPLEIPGVSNQEFLEASVNAQRKGRGLEPLSKEEFESKLDQLMDQMEIRKEFKTRNINEGFSGGEKKKNEILQMALFEPTLAVLDETDSGLDIDAIRTVAKGINEMRSATRGFILITHYQRLLDHVLPDVVHVLADGAIVKTGDAKLAQELEETGYAVHA